MSSIIDYIRNSADSLLWKYIIIHHSATKDGISNNWEQIRLWHTGKIGSSDSLKNDYNPYIDNPMQDIGYNFGLELVDNRLEYQIGRSLDKQGAHTKGMNDKAIGICLVGDYDRETVSHEQYFLLASLCRGLMDKFKIPIYNLQEHNNYADKTCPGTNFNLVKLKYEYIRVIQAKPPNNSN